MSTQTIYDRLRQAGLSETGALALMGNFQAESGNESCRLQGDYKANRAASKAYAEKVDKGTISRESFARDGKGWGLAQWTLWTRKDKLLSFCRELGVSIADELAQVDFAVKELKESWVKLWSYLCTCGAEELYYATDRICREYECPAYNNVKQRFEAAKALRDNLDLAVKPAPERDPPTIPDTASTPFWPPRMLTKGMTGSDVTVLQALLIARGYDPGAINGKLGKKTQKAMWDFQKAALGVTGDFGPKSWAALLKY